MMMKMLKDSMVSGSKKCMRGIPCLIITDILFDHRVLCFFIVNWYAFIVCVYYIEPQCSKYVNVVFFIGQSDTCS